jgi:hypothetical protein
MNRGTRLRTGPRIEIRGYVSFDPSGMDHARMPMIPRIEIRGYVSSDPFGMTGLRIVAQMATTSRIPAQMTTNPASRANDHTPGIPAQRTTRPGIPRR